MNVVKFELTNKINEIACAETMDVLAAVVMEFVKKIFENVNHVMVKHGKEVKRMVSIWESSCER